MANGYHSDYKHSEHDGPLYSPQPPPVAERPGGGCLRLLTLLVGVGSFMFSLPYILMLVVWSWNNVLSKRPAIFETEEAFHLFLWIVFAGTLAIVIGRLLRRS
jgi:hypothetical protein